MMKENIINEIVKIEKEYIMNLSYQLSCAKRGAISWEFSFPFLTQLDMTILSRL